MEVGANHLPNRQRHTWSCPFGQPFASRVVAVPLRGPNGQRRLPAQGGFVRWRFPGTLRPLLPSVRLRPLDRLQPDV